MKKIICDACGLVIEKIGKSRKLIATDDLTIFLCPNCSHVIRIKKRDEDGGND